MLHLLRNAIGHGIESPEQRTQQGKAGIGKLCISASQAEGQIFIEMRDDGRGIHPQSILAKIIERGDLTEETAAKLSHDELMQFLFLPGFSTAKEVTDLSGRGVGLDIVKSEVEAIGGKIQVRSQPGEFTAFSLEFPATISLTPTLAVVGGHSDIFGKQIYLLPVNQIVGLFPNHQQDTLLVEDRQMFKFNDRFVPYCELRNLFQQQALPEGSNQTMIVLGTSGQYAALLVEAVLHEENVIVQSCDARIGKLQDISGVATLRNGKGALMLDVHDLLNTIREMSHTRGNTHHHAQQTKNNAPTILVVEDSATVRELMKQMLTANGYQVVTAVDGQDGLHKFEQASVDLVVSDIDMPRMNGFEMVRQLRATKKNADVPILMLSYKERDQDKQTAFQVGANDYLTKAEFDKGVILHAIERHLSKDKQRGTSHVLAG
jgi:two-component system sensor histidine kinase and response regulator WspE